MQAVCTSLPLSLIPSFTVLREVLDEYRAPRLEGQPPFTGGFVGYFAYAMLGYAEPTLKIKRGAWDDFDLMLFDKVIAYDHLKQKICLLYTSLHARLLRRGVRAVRALHLGQLHDQHALRLHFDADRCV